MDNKFYPRFEALQLFPQYFNASLASLFAFTVSGFISAIGSFILLLAFGTIAEIFLILVFAFFLLSP